MGIIKEKGGSAFKPEVEEAMFNKFKELFLEPYYQELVGAQPDKNYLGIPRWKKDVQFARNRAKDIGLIKRPQESARGVWELTNDGWNYK